MMTNTQGMTPNQIVAAIRKAIFENTQGRGSAVIGTALDSYTSRIIDARVRRGVVQGKRLSSGEWFELDSCSHV